PAAGLGSVLDAWLAENAQEHGTGLHFRVGGLRLTVNLDGEGFDLVREPVDRVRDGILDGVHAGLRVMRRFSRRRRPETLPPTPWVVEGLQTARVGAERFARRPRLADGQIEDE